MQEPISLGPCGGSGGSKWSYDPRGPITHIAVEVGRTSNGTETINAIQFKNYNANGVIENSPVYGSNRHGRTHTVSNHAKLNTLRHPKLNHQGEPGLHLVEHVL